MKSNKKSTVTHVVSRSSITSSSSSSTNEISRKWLTISTKNATHVINVVPETRTQCFEPLHGKPCNLVSVFGSARQGKSFLLNCLSGRSNLFRISNSKDPCTQGIDISNVFMPLSEFSGRPPPSVDPMIGFVDVEGQGDRDVNYDAKLICPILLVSKCIIFNWMVRIVVVVLTLPQDSLQKNRILELLGIMQKAAKNVSSSSSSSPAFNCHLHIVFRDWSFASSDPSSVKRDLFAAERGDDVGALTRNHIRQVIVESFESISIWLFPHPTQATSQLRQDGLTLAGCNNDFKICVVQLRAELASQLSSPSTLNNKVLSGPDLFSLVSSYVDTLNRNEVIVPESAFIQMIVSEARRVLTEFDVNLNNCKLSLVDRLASGPHGYDDVVIPFDETIQAGLAQAVIDVEHILGSRSADVTAMVDELKASCKSLMQEVEALYDDHVEANVRKAKQTVKVYIDRQVASAEGDDGINSMLKLTSFLSTLRTNAENMISLLPFPVDHDCMNDAIDYIKTYVDSKIHVLQARVIECEARMRLTIADKFQTMRDELRRIAESAVADAVEKDVFGLAAIKSRTMMRMKKDFLDVYVRLAQEIAPTDSENDVWRKCRELHSHASELIESTVTKNYSLALNDELNSRLSEGNIFIEESFESVKAMADVNTFDYLVTQIVDRVWTAVNKWDLSCLSSSSSSSDVRERINTSLLRYANSLKAGLQEKQHRLDVQAKMMMTQEMMMKKNEDDNEMLIQSAIRKSRIATEAAQIALMLQERRDNDDHNASSELKLTKKKKTSSRKQNDDDGGKMEIDSETSSSIDMPPSSSRSTRKAATKSNPVKSPASSSVSSRSAVTSSKKKGSMNPTDYAILMASKRWTGDDDDDVQAPPHQSSSSSSSRKASIDEEEDAEVIELIGSSPPKTDVIERAKWDERKAQVLRSRQVKAYYDEEEDGPRKRKHNDDDDSGGNSHANTTQTNKKKKRTDDDDDSKTRSGRTTLALPASMRAGAGLMKPVDDNDNSSKKKKK